MAFVSAPPQIEALTLPQYRMNQKLIEGKNVELNLTGETIQNTRDQ
jgi:hypothetical protein